MNVKRAVLVSAFATIGVVLMATSAWAWCSPYIDTSSAMSISPSAAAEGTVVRVTGAHWAPGPVEAHWGSPSGRLLGRTTVDMSLSFSLDVRIPAGSPERSIIVFHTGSVESQRSHPFVVLGQDGAPIGETGGDTGSATTSGRVGGRAVPPVEAAGTGAAPAGAIPAGDGLPAAPAEAAASPKAVGAAGRLQATPAAPAGIAGRLVNPVPVPAAAATPTVVGPAAEVPAAASSRAALSDLWSGFSGGQGSSSAGMVDLSETSDSGVNPVIVLPLGMVALLAGFGLAEIGRRRATASVLGQ